LISQPPLEYHYQGETLLRTLWSLFESDWLRLLVAVVVFILKHNLIRNPRVLILDEATSALDTAARENR
jgi:ABC-type molybdenum transport system ATPase subunit/photorepair protein PhrA